MTMVYISLYDAAREMHLAAKHTPERPEADDIRGFALRVMSYLDDLHEALSEARIEVEGRVVSRSKVA